jgi:two-component system response regulator GlrR
MADESAGQGTLTGGSNGGGFSSSVQRFRLRVAEGSETGQVHESQMDLVQIGSHALNDLRLSDGLVSRFHCEVFVAHRHPGNTDRAAQVNVWLRDLGSRNGTRVDGVLVKEAALRQGSLIRLGNVTLRFELCRENNRIPVSEARSFGSLVGGSIAARTSFALMERAAASRATILLEGETGTGKSQAAESIHRSSSRRDFPFLVVDCGAIPASLLESELFGHEKGAFTGASCQQLGIFEEAKGGTVLLDEIGELPLELQPKLLHVLEEGEIRRVGRPGYIPVDVRIIAATHRDLRAEVNAQRFRSDLYWRLAVMRIVLPALRERPEDIPAVVEQMLIDVDPCPKAPLLEGSFLEQLKLHAWPGNVRELRNHLERCLVMQEGMAPDVEPAGEPGRETGSTKPPQADTRIRYQEGKQRAIEAFERAYLQALLDECQGKVAVAAQRAGIDRVYFYKLIRKLRLRH